MFSCWLVPLCYQSELIFWLIKPVMPGRRWNLSYLTRLRINYWTDLWVRSLRQCVGWVQNLPDDEPDDGMNNECEWGSCGQWKEKKDELLQKLVLQKMFDVFMWQVKEMRIETDHLHLFKAVFLPSCMYACMQWCVVTLLYNLGAF